MKYGINNRAAAEYNIPAVKAAQRFFTNTAIALNMTPINAKSR